MDPKYSNREIDRMNKEITNLFLGQNIVLEKVLTQVTKTNGRVTKLEKILLGVGCFSFGVIIIKFPDIASGIKALFL